MKTINRIFIQPIINHFILLGATFLLLTVAACKKFVEIGPPKTQLVTATVFTSDATATAAIDGIYSNMVKASGFAGGAQSITSLSALSADELQNYSNTNFAIEFYTNSLEPSNTYVFNLWKQMYSVIYDADAVLEGLSKSSGVSDATSRQLQGEAKFIRGFCNFYLTNLYGDIPLITSTDYQVNAVAKRIPQSQVYQQIIADLSDAQSLLSSNYVTAEKTRPNKDSATGLLARVYLYLGDWKNAELQATAVISDSQYSLTTLNNVFLKNNTEAIWQLQPVLPGYSTFDGSVYILTTKPTNFALTDQLVNAFEIGDNRKIAWVGSIISGGTTYYFPYKYKVKTGTTATEYTVVLRLAEQYLIRAEARAQLNDISDAQSDLNVIRHRAGLANTVAATQATLLSAIEQERKVELFVEWGHRWFDLKRTNRANTILPPTKGANWQPSDQLYPVPLPDIANDPNLTQNTGY